MKGKLGKLLNRICASALTVAMVATMLPANVTVVRAEGEQAQAATGPATDVSTTKVNTDAIKAYAAKLLETNTAKMKSAVEKNTYDANLTWDTEDKSDTWRYYNGVMIDSFQKMDASVNNEGGFAYYFYESNVSEDGAIAKYGAGQVDSVPAALGLFAYIDDDTSTDNKYEKAIQTVYNNLDSQQSLQAKVGNNFWHKTNSDSWETWVFGLDGIYMASPFIMRCANAIRDGKISIASTNGYVDATGKAAKSVGYEQLYKITFERLHWVAEHMQSKENGLYNHGSKADGTTYNGQFWARGIGWYAVALADIIEMMPADYTDAEGQNYHDILIGDLKRLFDGHPDCTAEKNGLLAWQDAATGMWYNLINLDSSTSNNKLETSGTAMIAYALMKAYNNGWVTEAKYGAAGLKAFNGIVANKYKSGSVADIYKSAGVSEGTAEYCNSGKYVKDEAKGIGLLIQAALIADTTANKLEGNLTDGVFSASTTIPGKAAEKAWVLSDITVGALKAANGKNGEVSVFGEKAATGTVSDATGKTILTTSGGDVLTVANNDDGTYTFQNGDGKFLQAGTKGTDKVDLFGTDKSQTGGSGSEAVVYEYKYGTEYTNQLNFKVGNADVTTDNAIVALNPTITYDSVEYTHGIKVVKSGDISVDIPAAGEMTFVIGATEGTSKVKFLVDNKEIANIANLEQNTAKSVTFAVSANTTLTLQRSNKTPVILYAKLTTDATEATPEINVSHNWAVEENGDGGYKISTKVGETTYYLGEADDVWSVSEAEDVVYLYKEEVVVEAVDATKITFEATSHEQMNLAKGEESTIGYNITVKQGDTTHDVNTYVITWESEDGTVATVDATGRVTAVGAANQGTYVVGTLSQVNGDDITPITIKIPVMVTSGGEVEESTEASSEDSGTTVKLTYTRVMDLKALDAAAAEGKKFVLAFIDTDGKVIAAYHSNSTDVRAAIKAKGDIAPVESKGDATINQDIPFTGGGESITFNKSNDAFLWTIKKTNDGYVIKNTAAENNPYIVLTAKETTVGDAAAALTITDLKDATFKINGTGRVFAWKDQSQFFGDHGETHSPIAIYVESTSDTEPATYELTMKDIADITMGNSVTAQATVTKNNTSDVTALHTITWAVTEDSDVISVDEKTGVVKGLKAGTATVQASVTIGDETKTAEKLVKVKPCYYKVSNIPSVSVSDISVAAPNNVTYITNPTVEIVLVDEKGNAVADQSVANKAYTIKWTTASGDYITVEDTTNGAKITAKKATPSQTPATVTGTITVADTELLAGSNNVISASVKVQNVYTYTVSYTIDKDSIDLATGETATVTATIIVKDQEGNVVENGYTTSWGYSKPGIVTSTAASTGLANTVKGLAEGETIVSISGVVVDGVTATLDTANSGAAPTISVYKSAVTASKYIHNFTENGKESDFYTISGNLTTNKGTVTYDGKTLTQCLKMESATSIRFTPDSAGKLTLVFPSSAAGGKIKVNGTSYTIAANAEDGYASVTVDIPAGESPVAITKDSGVNLFYIVYETEGTTEPSISLNKKAETLAHGQSTTVVATLQNAAQDATVAWTFDKEGVTVDPTSGKSVTITGTNQGDNDIVATVTATLTSDGKKYTDTIQVTVKPELKYTGELVGLKDITVTVGDTITYPNISLQIVGKTNGGVQKYTETVTKDKLTFSPASVSSAEADTTTVTVTYKDTEKGIDINKDNTFTVTVKAAEVDTEGWVTIGSATESRYQLVTKFEEGKPYVIARGRTNSSENALTRKAEAVTSGTIKPKAETDGTYTLSNVLDTQVWYYADGKLYQEDAKGNKYYAYAVKDATAVGITTDENTAASWTVEDKTTYVNVSTTLDSTTYYMSADSPFKTRNAATKEQTQLYIYTPIASGQARLDGQTVVVEAGTSGANAITAIQAAAVVYYRESAEAESTLVAWTDTKLSGTDWSAIEKIGALDPGTYIFTVMYEGTKLGDITLNVTGEAVQHTYEITLNKLNDLTVGDALTAGITVKKDGVVMDAADYTVALTAESDGLVTIDGQTITAVKAGTTNITATLKTVTGETKELQGTLTATQALKVVPRKAEAGFAINPTNKTLEKNESFTITPALTTDIGAFSEYTYIVNSSNTEVAEVAITDDNTAAPTITVTGKAVGTATIQVALKVTLDVDGVPEKKEFQATCTVRVMDANSVIYTRVTEEVANLANGKYVIVRDGNKNAFTFVGNEISGEAVASITERIVDLNADTKAVWELEKTDGNLFYIKQNDSYLYASGEKTLALTDEKETATAFTLTKDGDCYKITWKVTEKGKEKSQGLQTSSGTYKVGSSGHTMRLYAETTKPQLTFSLAFKENGEVTPLTAIIDQNGKKENAKLEVVVTATDVSGKDVTADCTYEIEWSISGVTAGSEEATLQSATTKSGTNYLLPVDSNDGIVITATLKSAAWNGIAYSADATDTANAKVVKYILVGSNLQNNTETIRKYGRASLSEMVYTSTYNDGTNNITTVIPTSELSFKHKYDASKPGTYTVDVMYGSNKVGFAYITVSDDPYYGLKEADTTLVYPEAGAVRIDKTADTGDFNTAGIAKVEMDVAGVSIAKKTDVVLITDVSNSMSWTPGGNDYATAVNETKLYKAMESASILADTLLTDTENSLTFVTFAGYDADNTNVTNSSYIDSVQTVFTAYTDADAAKAYFDNTQFKGTKLHIGNTAPADTDFKENRGNTNYDYAFKEAAKAVDAVQEKYTEEYAAGKRETVIIFLTDGAPSHYNKDRFAGNGADKFYGESTVYPAKSGTQDSWLEWMSQPNDAATALMKMDDVSDMYVVGYDIANGGIDKISWPGELEYVLQGLVAGESLPVYSAGTTDDGKENATLQEVFAELAEGLVKAGTAAVVTDIINSDFTLQTEAYTSFKESSDGDLVAPDINLIAYELYTAETCGEDVSLIGTRTGKYTVLETLSFTENGVESTVNGETKTLAAEKNAEGKYTKIVAENFTYTMENGEEKFIWKIDEIPDTELAMTFYEKLKMNVNEAEDKIYYTNYGKAELKYVDVNTELATQYFPEPNAYLSGAVTEVQYYLVNEDGAPINKYGVEVSFANREIIQNATWSRKLEIGQEITIYGNNGRPNGYDLYSEKPHYTIKVEDASGTSGFLTIKDTQTNTKGEITTKWVDKNDGDYSSTLVAVAVKKNEHEEAHKAALTPVNAVLEYGKKLVIDVLQGVNEDDHISYGAELVGFASFNAKEDMSLVWNEPGSTVFDTEHAELQLVKKSDGTTEYHAVEYTLSTLLSEVDQVCAVIRFTDAGGAVYYMHRQINIIPATSVYYETDFSGANNVFTYVQESGKAWTTTDDGKGSAAFEDTQAAGDGIYGYDASYANDAYLSNGGSVYVEGQGIKKTITKFTFTGTGFDLISKTGKETATVQVQVYKAGTTESVKKMTVVTKGENDFYQIPIVSIEDLPYAKYDVEVRVNKANTYPAGYEHLNTGNQFYFDAIRIWNPVATSTLAQEVYMANGEANPTILEVRDQLIDKDGVANFGDALVKDESLQKQGAIYVDVDASAGEVNVNTYANLGPKNEVYLAKGQAVAFKLTGVSTAASIDVGLKSVDGKQVTVKTVIAKSGTITTYNSVTMDNTEIASATAQYYDMLNGDSVKDYLTDDGSVYVYIANNTTSAEAGILSITDIKIAEGSTKTVTPAMMCMDYELLSFLDQCAYIKDYSIHGAAFTTETCGILRTAELEVVTTKDVESLGLVNQYGWKMHPEVSYVDREDGTRLWTVKLRMTLLGKQTYTVTGYGTDGTAGTSADAEIQVTLW